MKLYCINFIVLCYRDRKTTLSCNGKPVMEAFENLISQVADHQREEGELVSSEDVMLLFRPLIPDTDIELNTRLQALTLLQRVCFQWGMLEIIPQCNFRPEFQKFLIHVCYQFLGCVRIPEFFLLLYCHQHHPSYMFFRM